MLLFYVDECGDDAPFTDDPESLNRSPYFALAAVGIRDASRGKLAAAFEGFKSRFLEPGEKWEATEIKGAYLRAAVEPETRGGQHHPGAWAALRGGSQGKAMVQYLEGTILRFRPLIYVAVIDKAALRAQGNVVSPLGAAYALLYERVSQMLAASSDGETAMFIADQQGKHEMYFRDGHLSKARAAMAERLSKAPTYEKVLDKPLWIDTDLSVVDREVLQLADLVAYSATAVVERRSGFLPEAYLWPAIHDCLARNWHSGGVLQGGLVVHPKPDYFDAAPAFPAST